MAAADADPPEVVALPARHRPGDLIAGRYRIERLIERGGMASVHAATDLELQRTVALKIATDDRLLTEARLLARLQHPNIAAIHDHGRTPEGSGFLVLEMVAGTSLRQFLAHAAPLHWRTALVIATQIASALQAAHARGVVHCDLTPSNVLVARTDQGALLCKVIDFGIAEHELDVRSAPVCGTRRYAAPETLDGTQVRADVRLDLYSLGALLDEMLAGGANDAPAQLVALTATLTATNPEARPASASSVVESLRRIASSDASSVGGPTRLAWCAATIAVVLAVGAMVSIVSWRGTQAAPVARAAPPIAPPPVRAELADVPLLIPVQATPSIEPPTERATASPPARTQQRPKSVAVAAATPRQALESALQRWRETQPTMPSAPGRVEISLDPTQRSARVVQEATSGEGRAREIVQYWALRDGRWQLLGD